MWVYVYDDTGAGGDCYVVGPFDDKATAWAYALEAADEMTYVAEGEKWQDLWDDVSEDAGQIDGEVARIFIREMSTP